MKYIKVVLLLVVFFFAVGCAVPKDVDSIESNFSFDQVPVASVEGKNAEISKSTYNRMVGDILYYIDSKWDEEEKKLKNISVYRLQRGSEESEILTDLGDAELISFFADETKAVYCFYTESEEETEKFYLRKMNQDKEVAYDVEVSYEGISGGEGPLVRIGTVAAGEADREGKVCLAGTQGDLYLFNEEGQIVRIEKAPWDGDTYNGSTCGLVNAGENGIYTWMLNGKKVSLQKVNMDDGTIEKEIEVNVEGITNISLTIYSGYDRGIFIADSNSLWSYLPSKGVLEYILDWGDSTVGLRQYIIDAISTLEDGSLYVAAHKPSQDVELVHIFNKDVSEIPETSERQIVTIGVLKHLMTGKSSLVILKNGIEAYERKTEYQVELHPYDSVFDLEMDLIRGEGPDLICLGESGVDAEILAAKGVLEDLEPYFEVSDTVKMDDLLPAVQEAGMIDEKFRCVHYDFWLSGLLVKKGVTDNGSWTAEDYIRLGEENPGIRLTWTGNDRDWYRTSVLENLIKWDRGHYVDWIEKKCCFDSDDFISLVERINNLEIQRNDEEYNTSKEAYMNRVFQGEELTGRWSISKPSQLVDYIEAMEEEFASLELAGYPTWEKEPFYKLDSEAPLGINSASLNKEAAWGLVEILLSEEFQKEVKGNIPVRQDAFYAFYDKDYYGKTILSEEGKERFCYLVEHAHWTTISYTDKILNIVGEEVAPVWAGDRTAKQAADIIQNRVSVYLNE